MPKKLKIGGYIFTIKYQDYKSTGNDTSTGGCRGTTQQIWIDNKLSPQMQFSTLLHEIIEAISWCHQLELRHSTIATLETSLYQILYDNKLLREL